MTVDWTILRAELRAWRARKLELPVWWRDDDTIEPTRNLDRLRRLSEKLALPVHLAVIPAHAKDTLVPYMSECAGLIPLVHGWAHANHATEGEKKSEFGRHRSAGTLEISHAIERFRVLFGPALPPVFVPPWNRLSDLHLSDLVSAGFRCLSTYGPRQRPDAVDGLPQINTHIDPIDWRGTRGLIAPDILIARVTELLHDRRMGRADNAEPLGYLTHHLVHTEDLWDFSHALLAELLDGGATPHSLPSLLETRT
jgi:hypothetical protein